MELLINISEIISQGNVRQVNDDVVDLAQSMKQEGQLVPIQVYPVGDKYVVKFGHRRIAAAKLLEWETIQAIVENQPGNEADILVQQVIENEHRQKMGYIEKAKVYQQLKDMGMSQKNISKRFGVSEVEVSLSLATLRSDPKIQKAVEDGRILPSAIEPLLSQPLEVQARLADAAIKQKTVRGVTALVKAYKAQQELSRKEINKETTCDGTDPEQEIAITFLEQSAKALRLASVTIIDQPDLVDMAKNLLREIANRSQEICQNLG